MRVTYRFPAPVVREHVAPDFETAVRWLASAPRSPLGGYQWEGWSDATTPRTERPVRFLKQSIADGEYPIIVS